MLRGLIKKDCDKWYVVSCCGKCNGIDEVCHKSLHQIHELDEKDIELIYEYSGRNDSDLWVMYTLEPFNTGHPAYTNYARISIEDKPPVFMTLSELDNLIDF